MMSFSILSMDRPGDGYEWSPDFVKTIIGDLYRSHANIDEYEKDCRALACCNKALSSFVLKAYTLCHPIQYIPNGPLYFIAQERRNLPNISLSRYCLWQAMCYLKNGHSADSEINSCFPTRKTLLHEAICNGDKAYVQLMLKCGADPYKAVSFGINGGPICNLNAFHWYQVSQNNWSLDSLEYVKYTKGNEPEGWLLDLCYAIDKEKK